MCSYKRTQVSPYDPIRLAIHSILPPEMLLYQILARIWKKLYLLMTLCTSLMRRTTWPMEIWTMVSLFTLKLIQKPDRWTKNRITFPDPLRNLSLFPVTININVFLMRSITLIVYLNPYNFWYMVPAALMSLNHTNDRYSMSNKYPQPTTDQPRRDSYPVLSPLRKMDSKRKGLCVSFAFFQRNYLPDGRVNETVATVGELSYLWKARAMDGIPSYVMNCNSI